MKMPNEIVAIVDKMLQTLKTEAIAEKTNYKTQSKVMKAELKELTKILENSVIS